MRILSLATLKYATRSLLRERGVTLVALASLAIGIAANATIFSLVQAVEFPTLIYPQASRLVFLETRNDARNLVGMLVSVPDAREVAAASHTLVQASLTADQESILREGETNRRVSGRRVEAGFFGVMGVGPVHGRVLTPGDTSGAIVLSDRLWREAFGGDPSVVGRPVHLDGGVVTVVGVMPPRFDADADFWAPLDAPLGGFARDDRQFTLFARLAPRASIDDAARELLDLSRRLAVEQPATNKNWVIFPTLLTRMHGRDSQGAFILLQAAVGFVLLIACANIANILLARGTRRRHEMALRLSLGATRSRLIGELLTESVLLAAAGGVAGVALAVWGIRLARASGGFPDIIDPTLNVLVLGFAAALSMLTGVLCGIVPALRASGVAPEAVLRAEGGRGGSASRGRLRAALVAVQIASAVVLVTCGALMVRTFVNREHVDLGFDPTGAIRGNVAMFGGRYQDPGAVRQAVDAMLGRLEAMPGVAAAGATTWALPTGAGAQRPFTLPREHETALPASVPRGVEAVTPHYFEALGVALERGRFFAERDAAGSEPVAIVNEELANRLWPNRDPIGESLRLGAPGAGPVVTVVGVVASIRRSAMHDFVVAKAYVPYAQYPGGSASFVVRARAGAALVLRALQTAVHDTDPSLLVEGLGTVQDDLARFVAPIRLITSLLAGFGVAGLLLAALGVFGTMSYSVSQRERELAVRSALGADARELVQLVLRGGLVVTLAGVIPGVAIALLAARALAGLLYGVEPTDPATIAAAVAGLMVVSLAACYRPARRAASVDPMTILRRE